MALNLNRVMLAGNVTRDPQSRLLGSGSGAVADFGLAINRRWKDSNGEAKEEVTFVDVTCFGKSAEVVADHVRKGKALYVEGRLKLEQWEDKEGQKRSKLKVIADSVQFTDSKPRDEADAPAEEAPPTSSSARRPSAPAKRPSAPVDDEPPF